MIRVGLTGLRNAALLTYAIGDTAVTAYALQFSFFVEANPVVRGLIGVTGLVPAMLVMLSVKTFGIEYVHQTGLAGRRSGDHDMFQLAWLGLAGVTVYGAVLTMNPFVHLAAAGHSLP